MSELTMLHRHLEAFQPGQRVLVCSPLGEYVGRVEKVDPQGWPTPITISSVEHGTRDHGPFRLVILPADSSPAAIEEWLRS